MASKRTIRRKRRDGVPARETVRELSRKALAEVATLLKCNQIGTITRLELNTGLKEVKERLKRIMIHTHRI